MSYGSSETIRDLVITAWSGGAAALEAAHLMTAGEGAAAQMISTTTLV